MSEPFSGENHHIFCDNFFTSVRLVELLKSRKMYACGTIRTNRKDWPVELRKPAALKLKPGDCIQMQRSDTTATVWHDKRDVSIISNNCDPLIRVEKRRHTKGKGQESIQCPLPVVTYNNGMGGVDLCDQKLSYYPIGRKTVKWWKYVLFFVINVCIVNASTLREITTRPHQHSKPPDQLVFRENLVRQLIGSFSSRRASIPSAPVQVPHLLERISARNCTECARVGRKTKNNLAVRTTWQCLSCQTPLCKNPCFQSARGFDKIGQKLES